MSNADAIIEFGETLKEILAPLTTPDYRTARGILDLPGRAPYSTPTPIVFDLENPATFEDKVALGIAMVERIEQTQWQIGDLANTLTQAEDLANDLTLTSFAHQIGMKPRTLQHYVRLARYWPDDLRNEWPNLRYSHYKSACMAYPSDLEAACRAMDYASAKGSTVADFENWLKDNRVAKEEVLAVRISLLEDTLATAYHTLLDVNKNSVFDIVPSLILEQVAAVLGLRGKAE